MTVILILLGLSGGVLASVILAGLLTSSRNSQREPDHEPPARERVSSPFQR